MALLSDDLIRNATGWKRPLWAFYTWFQVGAIQHISCRIDPQPAAAQSGNVLRLVPSQVGTAFRTSAIPLDGATAFETAFEFLVTSDPNSSLGATDGFTFILQNDSVNAVGVGG